MPLSDSKRLPGIDFLRVAAMAAIVVQHALSITDNDHLSTIGTFRIGRIGTATFFLIGGYFAALDKRPPLEWLRHRLQSTLLPFWISLSAVFLIAGITGYKKFDAMQVVCQMSGIGIFTHPGRLVGVTTWFVSAILCLYLLAYLAKLTLEVPVVAASLAGSLVAVSQTDDPRIAWLRLAAMFLVGYLIPLSSGRTAISALAWLVPVSAAGFVIPELKHGAAALLLFVASLLPQWRIASVRWIANRSYEAYLTHGLSLHAGKAFFGPEFWPVLFMAVPICIAASVSLKWLVSRIRR